MKQLANFLYAVLGGAMVGVGGIAYLSSESKPLGMFLFTVGLFTIYTFGFYLFTGKVCAVCENKPSYLGFCTLVWVGNFVGTFLVALAVKGTHISYLAEKAATVAEGKLSDTLLGVFILAVFCNVLIYIAAQSYANNPHEVGKYLGMVFGVMVFIVCGFEHCIANMFYFSLAGVWSGKTLLYLLVATLGNAVGGNLLPLAKRFYTKANAQA